MHFLTLSHSFNICSRKLTFLSMLIPKTFSTKALLWELNEIIRSVAEFRAKGSIDIIILSHVTTNLRKNLVLTCGHGAIGKVKLLLGPEAVKFSLATKNAWMLLVGNNLTRALRNTLSTLGAVIKKKYTIIIFRNNLPRNDTTANLS